LACRDAGTAVPRLFVRKLTLKIFDFVTMIFESVSRTFDSVAMIFDFVAMIFECVVKKFDSRVIKKFDPYVVKKFDPYVIKKFDPAVAVIFDPAIVMTFDHVCINLDHLTPDKAKFSSTKSQLLFTFAAPDTRGLRLKDMHLLILWSFDKGLWQSTTSFAYYSSAGFGPSNRLLRASSASTLFECGRSCPSNRSFGPAAPPRYSSAGALIP
jgi:hypothetical protein